MALVEFRVAGTAKPQGSKVPGVSDAGKKFVREQAGAALVKWRKAIIKAAGEAMGDTPPSKLPLKLEIIFYMQRGKTVKRVHHTVYPDLDKMIRAVGDSLKIAGVVADDAQFIYIVAQKFYVSGKPEDEFGGMPGAWIRVTEIP